MVSCLSLFCFIMLPILRYRALLSLASLGCFKSFSLFCYFSLLGRCLCFLTLPMPLVNVSCFAPDAAFAIALAVCLAPARLWSTLLVCLGGEDRSLRL